MKALVAVALIAAAGSAQAQQRVCAARGIMVAGLASEYDELPQAMGLDGRGQLFEIFASTEDGTWTILRTGPDGLACIMADGHSYEAVRVVRGDPA